MLVVQIGGALCHAWGGLNIILKHAASCQKAAGAREDFHVALLFAWLVYSNAVAAWSSCRQTQGKIGPINPLSTYKSLIRMSLESHVITLGQHKMNTLLAS